MPYKDPAKKLEHNRQYRKANKEKVFAWEKKYQQTHKEQLAKKAKVRRAANLKGMREYQRIWANNRRQVPMIKKQRNQKARQERLAFYGLTEDEYKFILREQGGVCAICEAPPKNRSLDVDHEHQRNEKNAKKESRKKRIRGLLCHRCNRALGLFGNDMLKLLLVSKNFAEYIEKYYSKRMRDKDANAIEKARNVVEYLVSYQERITR